MQHVNLRVSFSVPGGVSLLSLFLLRITRNLCNTVDMKLIYP